MTVLGGWLVRRRPCRFRRCGCVQLPQYWRRKSCRRRCGRSGPPCGWPRRALRDASVAEHDLDFHLGQEIDDIFGASVEFGMAFLASEALGLGDGDALQSGLLKRFLHFVQLEWLDDRFDLFHVVLHCQKTGCEPPLAPPSSTNCANPTDSKRSHTISKPCRTWMQIRVIHCNGCGMGCKSLHSAVICVRTKTRQVAHMMGNLAPATRILTVWRRIATTPPRLRRAENWTMLDRMQIGNP